MVRHGQIGDDEYENKNYKPSEGGPHLHPNAILVCLRFYHSPSTRGAAWSLEFNLAKDIEA